MYHTFVDTFSYLILFIDSIRTSKLETEFNLVGFELHFAVRPCYCCIEHGLAAIFTIRNTFMCDIDDDYDSFQQKNIQNK